MIRIRQTHRTMLILKHNIFSLTQICPNHRSFSKTDVNWRFGFFSEIKRQKINLPNQGEMANLLIKDKIC